jgi:hypothetical protein
MSDEFDPVPEWTEQQFNECMKNKDFMPIVFGLFQALNVMLVKLCNCSETNEAHEAKSQTLPYKIIQGHLLRGASISLSMVKLAVDQKHRETIFILQRCAAETCINAMFLMKLNSDDLFSEYIDVSFAPERELWDFIQANIRRRGGSVEPIEEHLMKSIERSCALGGKTITDISPKFRNWGPNARLKFREFGLEPVYNAGFRIASHAVHGSFVDLTMHYLEQDAGGQLQVKDPDNYPGDAQFTSTGLLIVALALQFVEYAYFDVEVKAALSGHIKDFESAFRKINDASIESRHGSVAPTPEDL